MKVKKYKDKTFSRAVFKAKSELGEDIMILDSEEIDSEGIVSGNQKLIEVTVTTDQTETQQYSQEEVEPSPLFIRNKKSNQENNHSGSKEPGSGQTKLKTKETSTPSISLTNSDREEESESLQEHKNDQDVLERALSMEQELKTLSQKVRKMVSLSLPETYTRYYEKLLKIGVAQEEAEKIIRKAYERCARDKDVERQKLINILVRRLKLIFDKYTNNVGEELQGNENILLVGAPGSGKTITTMKMAANQDIIPLKDRAIASLDNFKLGGKYPLDKFSALSSIPFYSEDLDKIINQSESKLTIIDTAGRNINDKQHQQNLIKTKQRLPNCSIQLVLDASDDLKDMERIFNYFDPLEIDGIILTKLDQMNQIGKLVSILKEYKVPLTFICQGQEIPEDINSANKSELVRNIKNLL